jgi:xanthine dehydrogenase molybdopterin-binding subunit B
VDDVLHNVGRSLKPAIDNGRIEGAFVQGMGRLTSEELVFNDNRRLLTHAPATYKIPRAPMCRRISASRCSTVPSGKTPSIAPRRWASRP